jgi:hypothetical protein
MRGVGSNVNGNVQLPEDLLAVIAKYSDDPASTQAEGVAGMWGTPLGAQVRQTQSWSRSWANFSLLYSSVAVFLQ